MSIAVFWQLIRSRQMIFRMSRDFYGIKSIACNIAKLTTFEHGKSIKMAVKSRTKCMVAFIEMIER